MPAVIVQDANPPEGIVIPAWVVDLASFRRWVESPDFPETGRFSFIHGNVWMDLSMEQLFVHNRLKLQISYVLERVVSTAATGYVFGDGARLHNTRADLSVEPDVMYVSFDALQNGRVALNEGAEEGFVSLDGAPDVLIEVVCDSSEHKDTVELRDAYFEAGIAEYWLVDARSGKAKFEILKRGSRGFSATRAQTGGWIKSGVFGRSFRITQLTDPIGNPLFSLEHRQ